jgi:hypothetical protein
MLIFKQDNTGLYYMVTAFNDPTQAKREIEYLDSISKKGKWRQVFLTGVTGTFCTDSMINRRVEL